MLANQRGKLLKSLSELPLNKNPQVLCFLVKKAIFLIKFFGLLNDIKQSLFNFQECEKKNYA